MQTHDRVFSAARDICEMISWKAKREENNTNSKRGYFTIENDNRSCSVAYDLPTEYDELKNEIFLISGTEVC